MNRHRGLTFTAVITMTASLMVLGLFLLTSYNVRQAIRSLEDRKEVVIYLRDDLTPEDYSLFENRIRMHPAVTSVQFVSREEAWEKFSESMNIEGLEKLVRHLVLGVRVTEAVQLQSGQHRPGGRRSGHRVAPEMCSPPSTRITSPLIQAASSRESR